MPLKLRREENRRGEEKMAKTEDNKTKPIKSDFGFLDKTY